MTVGYPTVSVHNENLPNAQLQSEDESHSMRKEEINQEEPTRAITDAFTGGNAHVLLGTFQAMMAPMPKGSDIMEMIKPIAQVASSFLPG